MYDAITFGSITIDVFLGTEAMERKGRLEYPAGTKINVRDVDFQTGGCGMNVAIGLKKLGCSAALLGKYGSDINGRMISRTLREEGVDFIGPAGKGKTGYSVVLDSVRHNRTILHFRGASNDLKPGEIDRSKVKAKWLYMASAGGDAFRTQKAITGLALKRKIKIAYNPGIGECRKGRRHIGKMLRASEMAIMNRNEAGTLSKKDSPFEMLKAIRRMGPKIVCITNGIKDIHAYENGIAYTLSPHKIRVVERTGAGDAFSAGILAGMVRGKGIEFSMQLGLANSESVIRYFGATNKLLSWNGAVKAVNRKPGRLRKAVA